jgi:hypothetical protein
MEMKKIGWWWKAVKSMMPAKKTKRESILVEWIPVRYARCRGRVFRVRLLLL